MFKAFSPGGSKALSPAITIESSVDRVSIMSDVDITRDRLGLELAIQLQAIMADAIAVLQQDLANGELPDELPPKAPTTRTNPLA